MEGLKLFAGRQMLFLSIADIGGLERVRNELFPLTENADGRVLLTRIVLSVAGSRPGTSDMLADYLLTNVCRVASGGGRPLSMGFRDESSLAEETSRDQTVKKPKCPPTSVEGDLIITERLEAIDGIVETALTGS